MSASRRPLHELDLLRLRAVTEPQISPDGAAVAYVRTHIDASWHYRSQLMLADARGERALTDGTARDRAPRWSPDGRRLAFVSDRAGAAQIHVLEVGEAGAPAGDLTSPPPITAAPLGVVGAPAWTADGETIVYSALVRQTPPPGRPGEPAPTMRLVREIDYKQDSTYIAHGARAAFAGFRDGRRQHVFAVPARGGPARQLTDGDFDHVAAAVAPDGKRVAFIAKRVPDADRTAVQHLWTVPVGGGGIERIGGGWGPISDFAWSPDGTRIAFIGHLLGDSGKDRVQPHIFVFTVPDGTPHCLTEAFAPTIGVWARGDFRMPESSRALTWNASGIVFLASWHGRAHVYRIDAGFASGSAPASDAPASHGTITRVLDGDRTIFSVSANDRGQIAFAAQGETEPGDIYRFDPGQGERRLTSVNADVLAEIEVIKPVSFTFRGTRGQDVDAWILPPAGAKPGERRPLVMNTHRGAHGLAFFFEFQLLAARGYAVTYCNHVGAQGYGPDYAVGQDKAWGGPDVEEMLRSIEEAAARFDFVDDARVGTTGLSAGGFYTNWLLSRTDRFRAGVSEGGIYNWLSKFGTSDIGTTYVISEMGGLPWERRDDYWRQSPLAQVDHVTAPLLIIHADEDHRCDITESEQMFRALRYLGRTVELLWVRGESHGFSRSGQPVNRVERLRRIVDWFDRHL